MKKTIDDWRKEYELVTGKQAAIRWNSTTLQKKITDAEILAAGYAAKERTKSPADVTEPNPEFEKLASQEPAISSQTGPEPERTQEAVPTDGRGGPREDSGRPFGQTDLRARVERVMSLEVPDLAVAIAVDGLNAGLTRLTGIGIDEKPVSTVDLSRFPHGSPSLALGLTRLLYFWFPSLQGRTDVVTLHLEALYLIINPLRERAQRIYEQTKKEKTDVEKCPNAQEPNVPSQPAVQAAVQPAVQPVVSVPAATARPKAKHAPIRTKRLKRRNR